MAETAAAQFSDEHRIASDFAEQEISRWRIICAGE
jgi:hypothetical protein